MELHPIEKVLSFKSGHWQDLFNFFKSLRKISRVESFIIMTCFKENLGKFARFKSNEVYIYYNIIIIGYLC